jgi:3-deoxy-D-manno-octulosonic-acid transferase
MAVMSVFFSRAPFAGSWNLTERGRGPVPKNPKAADDTVWIHAASLGESKLLIRFLGILRKKNPGRFYLLTATTKTGVDYLRTHDGDDIAGVGFLPVDTIGRMRKMIDTFHITRVWVMETELWPSMLWTCRRKAVPLGLVNARIEERSLSSYRRLGWLLSDLLRYPGIVLAQNEAYAGRFERLGIPRQHIHIIGNLKSSVSVHPLPYKERAGMRAALSLDNKDLCLTAGCLHSGEGVVLRKALDIAAASGLTLKCIIVPRHLRETHSIARELGPSTIVFPEPRTMSRWDICIIDKMGILDAMYRIADAAFVGGTFNTTGGHNMWDPAQFGIPVLFGPNIHTQQESVGALTAAGVGFQANTAEELARALIAVLRDKREQFIRSRDAFMDEINRERNTIENVIP